MAATEHESVSCPWPTARHSSTIQVYDQPFPPVMLILVRGCCVFLFLFFNCFCNCWSWDSTNLSRNGSPVQLTGYSAVSHTKRAHWRDGFSYYIWGQAHCCHYPWWSNWLSCILLSVLQTLMFMIMLIKWWLITFTEAYELAFYGFPSACVFPGCINGYLSDCMHAVLCYFDPLYNMSKKKVFLHSHSRPYLI